MGQPSGRAGRIPAQAIIVVVLLAIAVVAIQRWRVDVRGDPDHLTVSGTVECWTAELSSKIGGRLRSVEVEEGDTVEAGQLLAQFDVPELEAQQMQLQGLLAEAQAVAAKLAAGARAEEIAQGRARVASAQAVLDELKLGTRSEDIAAAEAAWRAAEVQYDLAVADLQRVQQLYDQGVMSRSQLDAAQARVDSLRQSADAAKQQYDKAVAGPRETQINAAEANLAQAQAALDLLLAGSRSEDIDAAQARVQTVQGQLQALAASLAEARVTAPQVGVVLNVNHEAGEVLAPGELLLRLTLPNTYYIQVFIPEQKLSWAQPGAKASLIADGFGGQTFSGEVSYLAPEGEFTPRNLQSKEKRVEEVFRCKVRVEDPRGELRPGMVCDVTFSRPGGGA
jgi:HlyD family secretion protein